MQKPQLWGRESKRVLLHLTVSTGQAQNLSRVGSFLRLATWKHPGYRVLVSCVENQVGCVGSQVDLSLFVFFSFPIESIMIMNYKKYNMNMEKGGELKGQE
jgi:hypothetical protein